MPEVSVFDTGNSLLAETPAQMSTGLVGTPGGQLMALTIRTASTTLTVLLNAADAKEWSETIGKQSATMSQSGLVVANGQRLPGGTPA